MPRPPFNSRLTRWTLPPHTHRTDNLRFQADKFHKTGRTLRNKMWWQNFKVQLIVLLIVILIAVIIFCSVCFSTLPRPPRTTLLHSTRCHSRPNPSLSL